MRKAGTLPLHSTLRHRRVCKFSSHTCTWTAFLTAAQEAFHAAQQPRDFGIGCQAPI